MRIQLLIIKQYFCEMYGGVFFVRQETSVTSRGLLEVVLPSMLTIKPGKQLIQINFFWKIKVRKIMLKLKKKMKEPKFQKLWNLVIVKEKLR